MSFIGIVTRKEQDTGVTLEAKVVTPNKKKYAKKKFKVKVKADALDDLTCCILDQATQVNKLNAQNEMNNIISSINAMAYSGEHATTISYAIEDITTPKLSDYLQETGELKKNGDVPIRPKYGEAQVSGYLVITVSKGEASVSSKLQVTVPSYTAAECIKVADINATWLWDLISGDNDSYIPNDNASGHRNISYDLNFNNASSIGISSSTAIAAFKLISNDPIKVTWTINDVTLDTAKKYDLYTESRISNSGVVTTVPYKSAYPLISEFSNIKNTDGLNVYCELVHDEDLSNSTEYYVRIGGISLTATLSLGDSTQTIVYDCCTTSKYLTNQEVMDAVLETLYVATSWNESTVLYKEDASSNVIKIKPSDNGKDSDGNNLYTITAFKNAKELSYEALGMKSIDAVTITNTVMDYTFDLKNQTNPTYMEGKTSKSTIENNAKFVSVSGIESRQKITLDIEEFSKLSGDDEKYKKFSCVAQIKINSYASYNEKTGEKTTGSVEATRYILVEVDTTNVPSSI